LVTIWLDSQVKTGVWGQLFTHFLPIPINESHSKRAWRTIENCLADLADRAMFSAESVLEVLPPLMNKMIVDFVDTTKGGTPALHQSERVSVERFEKV